MYDLIIIGGGPAGTAAGVYAARKRLKTLFLTESFGGQSNVSADIQNWIGTVSISGDDLGKAFRKHLEAYAGDVVTLVEKKVESLLKNESGKGYTVKTGDGEIYESEAVLVATGSVRRKLQVPGAEEFENKGITYCASCDGPLFGGRDVVVIGGGNAAFETAAQLLEYAKSVTLVHHSAEFRADAITVAKVLAHPNMKAIKNAETTEVRGEKFVNALMYKDKTTGEEKEIKTEGVFVEIGLIPSTSFVEGVLELTPYKQIVVDPRTQRTSAEGVWAAGDCTDVRYHQNNIAAGDGVKALEDIYLYLRADAGKTPIISEEKEQQAVF
ncbi:MAG TPA: FAD-dependent oxidoreductase [Candidatus Paceibacterota bacterium]|nr:FAD-dependent oxidoreductase [Candidatus Paceibacterota bacterium]